MARVELDIPKRLRFTTTITVRITDINYRGHVGGDGLLGMMHEARARFLRHLGFSEADCGGVALIISDTAIVYKSETFEGEVLCFDVGAGDLNAHGFDVLYNISERASGREVAKAKVGMVCFDYDQRKVADLPDAAAQRLGR